MLVALGTALSHADRWIASSRTLVAPHNWAWMLVTWVLLKMVHELGHGLACKRFGGRVKDSGIILLLLAPLAYVDVTSTWSFPSKWKRMLVAAAGMYVELIIAALAVLWWAHCESRLVAHHLFNIVVMASISTVLFNANPLMRFDGYFLISDLLEIPNLYQEGNQVVRAWLNWLFLGVRDGRPRHHGWRNGLVHVYGFAAVFWKLLVCASLSITAAAMFHGAGIALATLGIVSWFLNPLRQLSERLRQAYFESRNMFYRAMLLTAIVAFSGWLAWSYLPSPAGIAVPGIIDFQEATVVRSPADGFIVELFVRDGQQVRTGDLLLRMVNPEIDAELAELDAALGESQVRANIARDAQQPAQVQIELRQQESLRSKRRRKQQEQQALQVVAHLDGQVIAHTLPQRLGCYVQVGDELLTIGVESRKELVLAVSHDDFDEVLPRVGQTVVLRIGSRPRIRARLAHMDPRATLELPHPALAATAGGPLAVEGTGASTAREGEQGATASLCAPRFRATIELPAAAAATLFAGERGWAKLGHRRERLGQWITLGAYEWLANKIAAASAAASGDH